MHPVTNMCLYGVNSNVKGDETLNIIQLTIKIVTITVLKATSDQKNDNHTHMHTHTYKHTHTLYIYIHIQYISGGWQRVANKESRTNERAFKKAWLP